MFSVFEEDIRTYNKIFIFTACPVVPLGDPVPCARQRASSVFLRNYVNIVLRSKCTMISCFSVVLGLGETIF